MPRNTYRIRKSFLIPIAVDAALLTVLLVLSYVIKGSVTEKTVLTVLLLTALFVTVEAFKRMVAIGEEGLMVRKFFRTKELLWREITHIGCLIVRRRVYILLTTTRGFFIISNAYDKFSQMVGDLIGHIPPDGIEVEDEARAQIDNPVRNVSDLIAAWVAAAALSGMIFLKLIA
ncbi:MAG: hypothetical protein PHN75_05265 [Syntrophales bacterium]|nr:hypothetical protein [Syntrophales bacterium]